MVENSNDKHVESSGEPEKVRSTVSDTTNLHVSWHPRDAHSHLYMIMFVANATVDIIVSMTRATQLSQIFLRC